MPAIAVQSSAASESTASGGLTLGEHRSDAMSSGLAGSSLHFSRSPRPAEMNSRVRDQRVAPSLATAKRAIGHLFTLMQTPVHVAHHADSGAQCSGSRPASQSDAEELPDLLPTCQGGRRSACCRRGRLHSDPPTAKSCLLLSFLILRLGLGRKLAAVAYPWAPACGDVRTSGKGPEAPFVLRFIGTL